MATEQEKTNSPALYALTPKGAELGRRIADQLGGDLFLPDQLAGFHKGIPFDRLMDIVAEKYPLYPGHIFITAAGIAVRVIAPHLAGKERDPAVVVLDHNGKHIISLLSGHLGGANNLAREVARITGGEPVITTATDTDKLPSADLMAMEKNLAIANIEAVKSVNMAILTGDPIQIHDPEDRLGLKNNNNVPFQVIRIEDESVWSPGVSGIWVMWKDKAPAPEQLILHPRCLIAGIGCNRGTGMDEILELIIETFNQEAFSLKSLNCITTIEDKNDEAGLLDAAKELKVPIHFFSRPDIQKIEAPNPSGIVKNHMGVSSVCEATALLQSKGGRLLVPKRKSGNVTLAVTLAN